MIKTRALARTFRSRQRTVDAVRGIDLDVASGELVGFLGPNGAGKTTTLRMLATLLRPSAGEALVAGCDLLADPQGVRKRIGYVGQGSGAGLDQRVAEELTLHGRFYGMSAARSRQRTGELLDSLDLAGFQERAPCPAASAGAWTSPWASSTTRPCCSSTSLPPGSTRRAGRTCGSTSANCTTAVPLSS